MTYREAITHNACSEGLDAVEAMLVGGWEAYGRDTPVSLVDVLDLVATDHALWALNCLDAPAYSAVYRDFCRMDESGAGWYWCRQSRAYAHLRMVLGGRIQPGHWREGEGWRS